MRRFISLEHVDLGVPPGRLRAPRSPAACARAYSSRCSSLSREELLDVGRPDGSTPSRRVDARRPMPGSRTTPLVAADACAYSSQEHLLVGEDVALVAEDVVELPQLVVEEARRAGDREHVATPSDRRCSARCGRTAGRASACRTRSSPPAAARRPSGTRWRRRTGAGARARGRARRRCVRSVGRASFWLSSRTPSYSTHSDESPIGPSVGRGQRLDHDLQAAVELDAPRSLVVSRKLVKPSAAQLVLQLAGRVLRQQHGRLLRHEPLRCAASKWSRCRWRHVQVVDVARASPSPAGSCPGTGTTTRSTPD